MGSQDLDRTEYVHRLIESAVELVLGLMNDKRLKDHFRLLDRHTQDIPVLSNSQGIYW
jgi:hypothetical protein